MADPMSLQPSAGLNSPRKFWRALLAQQQWDWAEAWLAMNPAAVSPDEVLSDVLTQDGGHEVADRLGMWALGQGANPARPVTEGGPSGLLLPLAILAQRTAVTTHLLNDPRAAEWLNTPLPQGLPLAHRLMQQARYATVDTLRRQGLSLAPAPDGSWPWEHVPVPFTTGLSRNDPSPQQGLATRLKALGVLPTTHEQWQAAATRMSKGVTRDAMGHLRAWLDQVAHQSVIVTDQEKQQQQLAHLITAWVQVSPGPPAYQAFRMSAELQQATRDMPPEAWTQPVSLPHVSTRSGEWTLAAAVAWAHAMMGPHHTQVASYPKDDAIRPFAWWDKLNGVATDDPVWTAPVFAGKGGTVTLQGLRSLATLESTLDTSNIMGQTRTPVCPAPLKAADYAAALSTVQAAVGHWGKSRRDNLSSTDWLTHWLCPQPDAQPSKMTDARNWADTHLTPVARHTALLNLARQGVPVPMQRVLRGLVALTDEERAAIKTVDWRFCGQHLKNDPSWLFETDPKKNPYLVDWLDNPLIREGRLTDKPESKALATASLDAFLPTPLLRPDTPFNQRLTLAVRTYWQLCGEQPAAFHNHQWSNHVRDLARAWRKEDPMETPAQDRLTWFMGWNAHRSAKDSLYPEEMARQWRTLREIHAAGERVTPALAQALAPLFHHDPAAEKKRSQPYVMQWLSNWVDDAKSGLALAPWQWLPQVGVTPSPLDAWQTALEQAAETSPESSRLKAQLRQQASMDAPLAPPRRRLRS